MNIFILDKDPILAAQYQCDKHVVKMILESAQLLCTTISIISKIQTPYRETHKNHPCRLWVEQSRDNFDWLLKHLVALCDEYSYRYNKVHKTVDVCDWIMLHVPELPNIGLTNFVQAMPEQYKQSDIVEAYRNYYRFEKNNIAKWNKTRSKPWWY